MKYACRKAWIEGCEFGRRLTCRTRFSHGQLFCLSTCASGCFPFKRNASFPMSFNTYSSAVLNNSSFCYSDMRSANRIPQFVVSGFGFCQSLWFRWACASKALGTRLMIQILVAEVEVNSSSSVNIHHYSPPVQLIIIVNYYIGPSRLPSAASHACIWLCIFSGLEQTSGEVKLCLIYNSRAWFWKSCIQSEGR